MASLKQDNKIINDEILKMQANILEKDKSFVAKDVEIENIKKDQKIKIDKLKSEIQSTKEQYEKENAEQLKIEN